MINNKPRELTLIYNSDKADDKTTRGYLQSLQGYEMKTLDVSKERITETQLAQIADKMHVSIGALLDPAYDAPSGQDKHELKQLDPRDLLTLMKNDPKLINTPIVVLDEKAFKVGTGYDIIKEDRVREVPEVKYPDQGQQGDADSSPPHHSS